MNGKEGLEGFGIDGCGLDTSDVSGEIKIHGRRNKGWGAPLGLARVGIWRKAFCSVDCGAGLRGIISILRVRSWGEKKNCPHRRVRKKIVQGKRRV